MPTPRTRRRCLRSHVCDSIRDHITLNRLTPGSRLEPIKRLSARFGASFRTVQQALVQLEAEGYVNLRHGSGTYVAEHPPLRSSDTVMLCLGTRGHLYGDFCAMMTEHLHADGRVPITLDTDLEEKHRLLQRAAFSDAPVFVFHGSRFFPFECFDLAGFERKSLIAVIACERRHGTDRMHRVLVDFPAAGRTVARHLHQRGHRRVLVVGSRLTVDLLCGKGDDFGPGAAFLDSWAQLGGRIRMMAVVPGDQEMPSLDATELLQVMSSKDAPTAVFGLRDIDAWLVQRALLERAPQCVQSVEIIGFGNTPWSQAAWPAFATVDWSLDAVARATCELIVSIGHGSAPEPTCRWIEPVLIERSRRHAP